MASCTASGRLRVVLGAWEFGNRKLAQDKACHEILGAFLARGYTEVDTALAYGNGDNEKIIGRYTASHHNRKLQLYSYHSQVLIQTKGNPWGPQGLKRESVLEQAATSLASLQTSCVDIFYLHAPDHNTPLEETLAACQQLYEEGKFKQLGLCNYASWEVESSLGYVFYQLQADVYHTCKSNGWVLPTVYQGMYNAITRKVEDELFPALRYLGLRFYAYNPTACGLLTGKYKQSDNQNPDRSGRFFCDPKWPPIYQDRYWRESTFKGIELVRKALDEAYGAGQVSLVSASFRWLNHHSMMKPECSDGICIGGSSLEQFEANLNFCEEGPLHPRVVKAFDEAWELDKAYCVNYFR